MEAFHKGGQNSLKVVAPKMTLMMNNKDRFLSITKMCPDAEAVNLMSLFIQTKYSFFIDVIGCDNCHVGKPGQVQLLGDGLEGVPGQHGQVGQVSAVNPHPHGAIANIV